MTHRRKVNLDKWEEITGKFIGIEDKGNATAVSIRTLSGPCRVQFPQHSREAESLLNSCKNLSEGQYIGILRTDIPDDTIKIRIIDDLETMNLVKGGNFN